MRCNTAQHSTAQHSTAQHSTARHVTEAWLAGTYCSVSIFFSLGGSILLYSLGVSSGHCMSSNASMSFKVLCLARDVTTYQGYLQFLSVSCSPGYITCLLTHSSCTYVQGRMDGVSNAAKAEDRSSESQVRADRTAKAPCYTSLFCRRSFRKFSKKICKSFCSTPHSCRVAGKTFCQSGMILSGLEGSSSTILACMQNIPDARCCKLLNSVSS